ADIELAFDPENEFARRPSFDQPASAFEIKIVVGILTSPALGWSVLRMISSSMWPAEVPGGTVTVSRYRPFWDAVSFGVILMSTLEGFRAISNLVGLAPRTSIVKSCVAPWLPLTLGIRNCGGTTLIGPVVRPAIDTFTTGRLGWSVSMINSS